MFTFVKYESVKHLPSVLRPCAVVIKRRGGRYVMVLDGSRLQTEGGVARA